MSSNRVSDDMSIYEDLEQGCQLSRTQYELVAFGIFEDGR